jgi:hypothetical protein
MEEGVAMTDQSEEFGEGDGMTEKEAEAIARQLVESARVSARDAEETAALLEQHRRHGGKLAELAEAQAQRWEREAEQWRRLADEWAADAG